MRITERQIRKIVKEVAAAGTPDYDRLAEAIKYAEDDLRPYRRGEFDSMDEQGARNAAYALSQALRRIMTDVRVFLNEEQGAGRYIPPRVTDDET